MTSEVSTDQGKGYVMVTTDSLFFIIGFIVQGCFAAKIVTTLGKQGIHLPILSMMMASTFVYVFSGRLVATDMHWVGSLAGLVVSMVSIGFLTLFLKSLCKKGYLAPKHWVIVVSGVAAIVAITLAWTFPYAAH